MELKLEDPVRVRVSDLAVGHRRVEAVVAATARAGDELLDPVLDVKNAVGSLRCEALVGVVVAADDELGARVVEDLPEGVHVEDRPMDVARAEEWCVEDDGRTACGVLGEILLEPVDLRRVRQAAADEEIALRVEGDDVPRAEVVAVIALRRIAGRAVPVAEVPGGARRAVFVAADCRLCPRLMAAPCGVVALIKLRRGAVLVSKVSGRHHGARQAVEERSRGRVAGGVAPGDVAGHQERGVGLGIHLESLGGADADVVGLVRLRRLRRVRPCRKRLGEDREHAGRPDVAGHGLNREARRRRARVDPDRDLAQVRVRGSRRIRRSSGSRP